MKPATPTPNDRDQLEENDDSDILEEYDFSRAMPNKYAEHYATGTNLVLLAPDVAARFPDSDTVNEALRLLIRLAQQEVTKIPQPDQS